MDVVWVELGFLLAIYYFKDVWSEQFGRNQEEYERMFALLLSLLDAVFQHWSKANIVLKGHLGLSGSVNKLINDSYIGVPVQKSRGITIICRRK